MRSQQAGSNGIVLIGIQPDLTDLQPAETLLIVSQQGLKCLLSSVLPVIHRCRVSSQYLDNIFISENVTAMVGYESREFIKNNSFWSIHLYSEDVPQVFAELSRAL